MGPQEIVSGCGSVYLFISVLLQAYYFCIYILVLTADLYFKHNSEFQQSISSSIIIVNTILINAFNVFKH